MTPHRALAQPKPTFSRSLKNLKAWVRICARFRPGTDHTTTTHTKRALRYLAHRYQTLTTEIAELDAQITGLCAQANPALPGSPRHRP